MSSTTPIPQLPTSDESWIQTLEAACAEGALERILTIIRDWRSQGTGPSIDILTNALREAVSHSRAAAVHLLIDQGAEPRRLIFTSAAMSPESNRDTLQALLEHGCDIHAIGYQKRPAILLASGDPNKLHWFLDNGADPNATSPLYLTPLAAAVWAYEIDTALQCVRLLLDAGARISRVNALHEGAATARIPVMELLLSRGTSIEAIRGEDLPQYHELRHRLAPLQHQGTPLHTAVKKCKFHSVRFLLDRGANPSSRDLNNSTPLQWAERREGEDYERIRRLLNKAIAKSIARS